MARSRRRVDPENDPDAVLVTARNYPELYAKFQEFCIVANVPECKLYISPNHGTGHYYDTNPPRVFLHPRLLRGSTDNLFTVLAHEVGHGWQDKYPNGELLPLRLRNPSTLNRKPEHKYEAEADVAGVCISGDKAGAIRAIRGDPPGETDEHPPAAVREELVQNMNITKDCPLSMQKRRKAIDGAPPPLVASNEPQSTRTLVAGYERTLNSFFSATGMPPLKIVTQQKASNLPGAHTIYIPTDFNRKTPAEQEYYLAHQVAHAYQLRREQSGKGQNLVEYLLHGTSSSAKALEAEADLIAIMLTGFRHSKKFMAKNPVHGAPGDLDLVDKALDSPRFKQLYAEFKRAQDRNTNPVLSMNDVEVPKTPLDRGKATPSTQLT